MPAFALSSPGVTFVRFILFCVVVVDLVSLLSSIYSMNLLHFISITIDGCWDYLLFLAIRSSVAVGICLHGFW